MCDTGVLEIGAVANDDPSKVAAQDGIGSDVAAFPDPDITDQYRGLVDESRGMNNRLETFKAVSRHLFPLRGGLAADHSITGRKQ